MRSLVKFERADSNFYDILGISYYIYGGCKFNCEYCHIVGYHRSNAWRQRASPRGLKHPTVTDQYKIVDTLFRIEKPFFIYLYGGEPTEYKHIHDIIKYILSRDSSYFKYIELQTNLNISREEAARYCQYEHIRISPTIHINFLRGDTIYDLVDKIDILYEHNKLERVDFVLEKGQPEKHRELHAIFKQKPYFDKIMYTHNYLEINTNHGGLNHHPTPDTYTGRFNTNDTYKDIFDTAIYKEIYTLTYDDGYTEDVDINDLYTRHMSFKGWECDAGNKLMLVEYTGDWWLCDNYNFKEEPRGNLLTSPAKFLLHTRVPHTCTLDKCDGCFFIKKERTDI